MHLVHRTLKTIGFLFFIPATLLGFDGHISPQRYSQNEIVIFAETIELKESVFGQLINESDYDENRPYWIPDGESVKLDRQTVEDFYFVETVVPRHLAELHHKNPTPSKHDLAKAEAKGAEDKASTLKKMKVHLNEKLSIT